MKSMKRRNFSIVYLVVMLLTLMSIGGVSIAEGAQYQFRLASDSYLGEASDIALQEFAKEVFEKSDGRIEIKIYPGAQLGNYDKVYPEIAMGTIDMLFGCIPGTYDTRVAITDFPYVTLDYDEAEKLWGPGGELESLVCKLTLEKGVKTFAVWGMGFGGYSFVKEPHDVATLAHKGMKVRVPATIKAMAETAKGLGYDVVPLPRAEVVLALQTGVIDGSVGSSPLLAYSYERDFIKYYVWYRDRYAPWFLVMNLSKFNSLNEQDQQMMEDIAKEKFKASFGLSEQVDRESLNKLTELGIKVIELTDAQLKEIADYNRKTVWPTLVSEIGQDILNKLNQIAGVN